jgi:hypothetical protein
MHGFTDDADCVDPLCPCGGGPAAPRGYVFTPRTPAGERLRWVLNAEDYAKIQRGRRWKATVTNLVDGKQYVVKGAACPAPDCFCDAVVVKENP